MDQLPSGWRERAREVGLIQPQPPQLGAKVTDIEPVLRLILHRAGLEESLRTTAAGAAAGGVIDLSHVAVHNWELKLAPYLAELSAKLCDAPTLYGAEHWSGYDIFALDATVVTRPGAEGTTARVHYVLQLAALKFVRSVVTDEHVGETLGLHESVAAPGQLWIVDRVYANPPGIAALVAKGPAVIARYNRGALPLYDARGKPFDVLKHVRSLRKPGAVGDWRVRVHPQQGERICGRLCAVRLPDDKVKEARDRLRREQGNEVTAEALEAAAWLMVFTTVPRSRMKAYRVLELYRLRWQIELEIKRDKSIGGLGKLPNFLEDTIATWLQAKLLIQHVAKKLASLAEPSPPSLATGTSTPSTPKAHAPGRSFRHRIASESWRVMTLIYAAIRTALLFVPLHEVPATLGTFLDHLGRINEQTRPKQIERFQQELQPAPGAGPRLSTGPPPAVTSTLTSSTTSGGLAPGRPLGQRIAAEAWRVTTLVYAAIRAAMTFVPLHEIPTHLGAFVEHLERSHEKGRPKQIELFQQELAVPGGPRSCP